MPARVIAEIGLHHGGSIRRAEELIASASACGCDAVKLQYFTEADMRGRAKVAGWDVLKKFYLNPRQMANLHAFANGACKVEFGLSFFGMDGVRRYAQTQRDALDFVKIPAPQGSNAELRHMICAQFLCPVVISYYPESALATTHEHTALHCTRGYPTPDTELNLKCISTMPQDYMPAIGWSCHAEARHPVSSELACLAYAAGARVFEFHYRDDTVGLESPDYAVSLWPDLMAYTIQQLRRCAAIMGD